jgi:hypothetical protein
MHGEDVRSAGEREAKAPELGVADMDAGVSGVTISDPKT